MTCASTGSPGRSRSTTDRRRGFTLLEVLVAFAVLAVALGVAFEIFATGLRGTRSADALTRAVLIAESRLAGVEIETELIPGTSEGETDDGTRWPTSVRLDNGSRLEYQPRLKTGPVEDLHYGGAVRFDLYPAATGEHTE